MHTPCRHVISRHPFTISLTTWQVVLRRTDRDDDDELSTEIVHAKFVIGADGK
jgi:hypothetical protein